MTIKNGYVTLAELKAYMPNSTNITDALAENAIMAASRAIDKECGCKFYPEVRARLYDVPKCDYLEFHSDLLEVIQFSNGDATTITTDDYTLWPYNTYPKRQAILNPRSTVMWEESDDTWNQAAISMNAIWGVHRDYDEAWLDGSTLNGALTDSATTVTVTSGTDFAIGNIIRVDDELMLVTAVSTNDLTVTRGLNGSTAVEHDDGSDVTIWETMTDIKQAAYILASQYYRRNESVYGTVGGGDMGVQPITVPQFDPYVKKILEDYRYQV